LGVEPWEFLDSFWLMQVWQPSQAAKVHFGNRLWLYALDPSVGQRDGKKMKQKTFLL
jgi:hypothetical protein